MNRGDQQSAILIAIVVVGATVALFGQAAWAAWPPDKLSELIIALCAGLAVLVAAAQAYLFVRQLRLMQDTLDGTKATAEAARANGENNRLAQRAWVTCIGTRTEFFHDAIFPNEDGSERFEAFGVRMGLRWVNVGYTPAVALTTWVSVRVIRAPAEATLPLELPERPESGGATYVAPRAEFGSDMFAIVEADLELLAEEKCRIFIFGGVEYGTFFEPNTRQETVVCFEAVFAGYANNNKKAPRIEVRVIGPHNRAT